MALSMTKPAGTLDDELPPQSELVSHSHNHSHRAGETKVDFYSCVLCFTPTPNSVVVIRYYCMKMPV
jgi:hypothetical protein